VIGTLIPSLPYYKARLNMESVAGWDSFWRTSRPAKGGQRNLHATLRGWAAPGLPPPFPLLLRYIADARTG